MRTQRHLTLISLLMVRNFISNSYRCDVQRSRIRRRSSNDSDLAYSLQFRHLSHSSLISNHHFWRISCLNISKIQTKTPDQKKASNSLQSFEPYYEHFAVRDLFWSYDKLCYTSISIFNPFSCAFDLHLLQNNKKSKKALLRRNSKKI